MCSRDLAASQTAVDTHDARMGMRCSTRTHPFPNSGRVSAALPSTWLHLLRLPVSVAFVLRGGAVAFGSHACTMESRGNQSETPKSHAARSHQASSLQPRGDQFATPRATWRAVTRRAVKWRAVHGLTRDVAIGHVASIHVTRGHVASSSRFWKSPKMVSATNLGCSITTMCEAPASATSRPPGRCGSSTLR